MRIFSLLLLAALLPHAADAQPTLAGATGLLTVPSAQVQDDGTAAFGASRYDPRPGLATTSVEDYAALIGFLPGLELVGNVTDIGRSRDLSFGGKYQLWGGNGAPALAIGADDVGGAARHYRSTYLVGTLPWRGLDLSLGYGWGPDRLEGAFGGAEWHPLPFLGVLAEYDTRHWNGGLRLVSPDFHGARLAALAAYRAQTDEVEYGAQLSFPLGRRYAPAARERPTAGVPAPAAAPTDASPASAASVRSGAAPSPRPPRAPSAPVAIASDNPALRDALVALGFESIRIGVRDPATQVVVLENRRYNHSAADGIGVALGAIATRADPRIERIELTVTTYGVPQVAVEAPATLYRQYLADASFGDALAPVLRARLAAVVDEAGVRWDGAPASRLSSPELVVEPLLRTFVATEYGVLDYALAARGRLTKPLGDGLVASVGVTAPLLESNDFHDGRNFAPLAPKAGLDLALLQFFFRPAPSWTWMWSLGRTRVIRTDLATLGLEQAWVLGDGTNRIRLKLVGMHGGGATHTVALLGYTWFDATRDYSVGITGGRFYADDGGVRVELNRYFGDTLVGAFFKYGSPDDQAAGMQISLPLTPRQDLRPGALQLKGPRRWGHSLSSTVNAPDQRNPLRPLFLYEPTFDLDLQRDLLDSGRIGSEYLEGQLPRMRDAWERYGRD